MRNLVLALLLTLGACATSGSPAAPSVDRVVAQGAAIAGAFAAVLPAVEALPMVAANPTLVADLKKADAALVEAQGVLSGLHGITTPADLQTALSDLQKVATAVAGIPGLPPEVSTAAVAAEVALPIFEALVTQLPAA